MSFYYAFVRAAGEAEPLPEFAFSDEMDTLSLDTAGGASANWADYFVGWNVRYLTDNRDQATKAHGGYVGSGGTDLETVTGGSMHEVVAGVLHLYGREVPVGNLLQFGQDSHTTGTVDLTNGSALVTGTDLTDNWWAGTHFYATGDGQSYEIASFDAGPPVSLTLTTPYAGTTRTGASYALLKTRFAGGMISSEMSHWRTYGTFECRMRAAVSKGQHVAMWLIPKAGGWPPEIDMLEIANDGGASKNKLYMNAHGSVPTRTYFNGTSPPEGGLPPYLHMNSDAETADWHVIKFVWTPARMQWSIDGVLRVACDNYITEALYFLIAPEIGNTWAGNPDGTTVWPMEIQVDYVRISDDQTLAEEPAPPTTLTETWDGTNGDPWNSTRWNITLGGTTAAPDIQGNRGRVVASGSYGGVWASHPSVTFTDLDLTMRFQLLGAGEQYLRVFVRAQPGTHASAGLSPADTYVVQIYEFGGTPGFLVREIANSTNGTPVTAATWGGGSTWGTGEWNLRVQCVGDVIRARAWPVGQAEPETWDLTLTDATMTDGYVQITYMTGDDAAARTVHLNDLSVGPPSGVLLDTAGAALTDTADNDLLDTTGA